MPFVQRLLKFNLFVNSRTQNSADTEAIRDQILSTRVYLILLTTSILTTTLFTVLRPITVSETVLKPSLDKYLQLEAVYSDALYCLCRQSLVKHATFFSLEPVFHEVSFFSNSGAHSPEKYLAKTSESNFTH